MYHCTEALDMETTIGMECDSDMKEVFKLRLKVDFQLFL